MPSSASASTPDCRLNSGLSWSAQDTVTGQDSRSRCRSGLSAATSSGVARRSVRREDSMTG